MLALIKATIQIFNTKTKGAVTKILAVSKGKRAIPMVYCGHGKEILERARRGSLRRPKRGESYGQ